MKQRITVEQFGQLNEKEIDKLIKWWQPKPGDYCTALVMFSPKVEDFGIAFYKYRNAAGYYLDFHKPQVTGYFDKKEVYPLLSIGQMIEFLTDAKVCTLGGDYMGRLEIQFYQTGTMYNDEELVDALWIIVKEHL